MKNVKTREEIVAEREAKKKAKLMAKKKSNAMADETQKPQPVVPSESQSQQTSRGGKKIKGRKSETDVDAAINPATETNQPATQANQPATGKEGDKENEKAAGDNETGNSTKAELKAARRLKQEAQRAAKAGVQKPVATNVQKPAATNVQKPVQKPVATNVQKPTTESKPDLKRAPKPHRVKLFNHLYGDELPPSPTPSLHPAVVGLGLRYSSLSVVGSNARCLAFMDTLSLLIADYSTPAHEEFSRGLESTLQPCLAHLHSCRPLSVSTTNAVKHLRWQMSRLPHDISDTEAKRTLHEAMDTYVREQIDVAAQAISIAVRNKISEGDVILTYGCSSLVQRILVEAHENGRKFRVVIVDARPMREGLQLLHRLVARGLKCSYVMMGAASCMMREATKVLLGAHALLANGYVTSRAGSAQIALLARSYSVPVLVCCETYKFSERVQTDAFVHNEIGDPDALAAPSLGDWRAVANLTPLNLAYDVTPPDLVTAVVTELAILPCTSVPVILRVRPTEQH